MTSRFNLSVGFAGALLIAACGGSPAMTSQPPTSEPGGASPTLTAVTPPGETAAAATAEPAASLTPGNIQFRVVNLREEGAPVDVYVRTMGLVRAAPVQMGLAYGEVTDWLAPPEPGSVVVTSAGAGDPTCVASCDHWVSESSTNFGEGDMRTMILYDEGTLDLWHDPDPDSVGSSGNALAPADPATALVYVISAALQDADGLRLGYATEDGCEVNRTAENVLVGGNQVAVFAFGGSADVVLFDNSDRDCSGEPVGGPFEITGPAGSRTLLILHGSPGAMEALTLEI